jgi:hypothetical protein
LRKGGFGRPFLLAADRAATAAQVPFCGAHNQLTKMLQRETLVSEPVA